MRTARVAAQSKVYPYTGKKVGFTISGNYSLKQAASLLGMETGDLEALEELGEVDLSGGKLTPKTLADLKQRRQHLVKTLGKQVAATPAEAPNAKRNTKEAYLHLGPTNSGKTYQALNALMEAGRGVYASPLRMLAFEAYQKIKSELGDAAVGLKTGEEVINPTAPILCVTPEVAPLEGEVLIIDEAQWISDPDRGWAWTQLLRSDFKSIHVCGALEVKELALKLFSDVPRIEVQVYERLSEIEYAGEIVPDEVPGRSVVVAFSRRKVLMLARELVRDGVRPSVLYGDLPPQVRRAELERFNSGETSIMVATDVVGHGVNMPVDNVIFAEGGKFDGTEMRPLAVWELAQIGGRAGRFGLSEIGRIFTLKFDGLDVEDKDGIVSARSAGGLISARAALNTAEMAPTFEELNITGAAELPEALQEWERIKKEEFSGTCLSPVSTRSMIEDFRAIEEVLETRVLSAYEVWSLLKTPRRFLPMKAYAGLLKTPQQMVKRDEKPEIDLKIVEDLIKFTKLMPNASPYELDMLEVERTELTYEILHGLDAAVLENQFGFCFECQERCNPDLGRCPACLVAFIPKPRTPSDRKPVRAATGRAKTQVVRRGGRKRR